MLRQLLHCMLALALAVAGIGNAGASGAMLPSDSGGSVDAHAMHSDATAVHGDRAETTDAPAAHADCGSDCCIGADTCQCPCVHLVQDIAFPIELPARVLTRLPAASAPDCGHPAPTLRDDIRPPIGPA